MTSAGVGGAFTAAGAGLVTTTAVLAWEPAVMTAGLAAAGTVGDVSVKGTCAAAGTCARARTGAAGAGVLAALTETFGVMAPLVDEPPAGDWCRAVRIGMLELALLATGFDFVACADDDGETSAGIGAVVDGLGAAVVVALLVEVPELDAAGVGFVLVVPVTFTDVSAPPEACTTPIRRSVGEPGPVEEFVDARVDDDAVPVLVAPVLDDDEDTAVEFEEEREDGEPATVEPLDEEPLGEEPLGSASAIAGLLAIATPNPSVIANVPTRPT